MNKMEMVPVEKLQGNLRRRQKSGLIQDVGLALFIFSLLGEALTIAFAGEHRLEYIVMFAAVGAESLLAAYRFRYLSVGVTGLQILTFMVYTLFQAIINKAGIVKLDYLWALLPLLSLAGVQLFVYELYQIEEANELLKDQMESVVLLDSLTGLYNLRALYIDLQRQMAYSRRNHTPISLMVVHLRYQDELNHILSRHYYDQMIQRLADLLSNTVRIEDRCYALDSKKGEFALLLTCNKEGSSFVRKRIEENCYRKDAFSGIVDKSIRVDLRMACVEYEEGIANAIEFKKKVDSELQYDV